MTEEPRSEPAFTNRTVAKVWRQLFFDWAHSSDEKTKRYIEAMLLWVETEFAGRKPE